MMTTFIIFSLALVAICLLFLLRPLLHSKTPTVFQRSDDLVAVYRDKLVVLKRQLDDEEIDDSQYQLARRELEIALASELPVNENDPATDRTFKSISWIIVIGLPLVAVTLYLALGNPKALSSDSIVSEHGSQHSLDEMVSSLEQKLIENPDNLQGWLLLGRSYAALAQAEKSSQAFFRAMQLAPDNAAVVLDYAESIARSRGDSLTGEPERLIDQALQLDPGSIRGRVLKGFLLVQQNQNAKALAIWQAMYLDQALSEKEQALLGQLIEAAGGNLPVATVTKQPSN
ncbi:MAG: c-type cytochrome biogenesis protein CcmI [Gammaproteobacteria bacterium]|nr:c-type cytochrome biogenesis protein CcmI [Gammaproteobacteria bacterium]